MVVERDPIITAKEVASLDLVSGGRVVFGVGVGWNREEMESTAPTEGTIYKRKDGRYEARYTVHTASGPKRRAIYGKTRAEVAEKLTKAMADRDTG